MSRLRITPSGYITLTLTLHPYLYMLTKALEPSGQRSFGTPEPEHRNPNPHKHLQNPKPELRIIRKPDLTLPSTVPCRVARGETTTGGGRASGAGLEASCKLGRWAAGGLLSDAYGLACICSFGLGASGLILCGFGSWDCCCRASPAACCLFAIGLFRLFGCCGTHCNPRMLHREPDALKPSSKPRNPKAISRIA